MCKTISECTVYVQVSVLAWQRFSWEYSSMSVSTDKDEMTLKPFFNSFLFTHGNIHTPSNKQISTLTYKFIWVPWEMH